MGGEMDTIPNDSAATSSAGAVRREAWTLQRTTASLSALTLDPAAHGPDLRLHAPGDCTDGGDAPALASALVATVRAETRPHFAPLYDAVYASVRKAGRHRQQYASQLHQSVIAVLRSEIESCGDDVGGGGVAAQDDEDAMARCRTARMLAEVLAPARHALGMGTEAFAATFTASPMVS